MVLCSRNLGEKITPIFALACTHLKTIELFQNFLNLLPTNSNWSDLINQPVEVSQDLLSSTSVKHFTKRMSAYSQEPCLKEQSGRIKDFYWDLIQMEGLR